jgi:hypothetical protein
MTTPGKGDIFLQQEMVTKAKEVSSLKIRYPIWQRRYIFFEEEMATLAK